MADGERYIFSTHIRVRLGNETALNVFGVGMVEGSVPMHEPLPQLFKAPTQMLQLAPGMLWCRTCANVRPKSYFDVVEWDERGKPTAWQDGDLRKPIAWDGARFPVKWHDECKQCVNMRDPKLRPVKYCSGCKQEKRRSQFSEDERYVDGLRSFCNDCEKLAVADRRRRKAEGEGRTMRPYVGRASA